MTGALCKEPGEKDSLANICVTEWCYVDCIPGFVSSTNERGNTQGTTMTRRLSARTRCVTSHRTKRWIVLRLRMNDETRSRSRRKQTSEDRVIGKYRGTTRCQRDHNESTRK